MTREDDVPPTGLPSDIRKMLWMQGLMNTSHFMTIPLLAMYMAAHLQFGAAAIASVMSANLICAQALPLAAGVIADRFGSHLLIAAGLLLRGAGFLGFCMFADVGAWVCAAAVAGTGVACYEGGVYGVFGRQPKARLATLFTANNQMLNIGTAVGPAMGGLAGLADARYAFAVSAVLFICLGVAALQLKFGASGPFKGQPALMSLKSAVTHRGLWRMIAISLPWFFLFPQLYVTFPLYAGKIAGAHAASAVYVVNGLIGLAFIVVMKRWLLRANPASLVVWAYLGAGVAFASVALLHSLVWFMVFIGGYTVIETILLPTFETMTASLATDGSQGTFFGVLSAIGAVGGAGGYYLGSWLILNRSAGETWLVLGGVGLTGFFISGWFLSLTKGKTAVGQRD